MHQTVYVKFWHTKLKNVGSSLLKCDLRKASFYTHAQDDSYTQDLAIHARCSTVQCYN